MGTRKNKQVVLRFLQNFSAGNFESAMELVADDVDWWVAGEWSGAGRLSKSEIQRNIAAAQANLQGTLALRVNYLTAEEDRVAADISSAGILLGGECYENVYHNLYFVKLSKIYKVREHLDTDYVIRRLFSREHFE